MKLVHYSNKPLTEIVMKSQGDDTFKPRGLWVSDDDCEPNWRSWCLEEDFQLDNLTHVHDVTLVNGANIMFLRTIADIDAFTSQWRSEIPIRWQMEMPWNRIRERYAGLIITPYRWERRLKPETGWYYGWDCASGCIWDPVAIASIKLRS